MGDDRLRSRRPRRRFPSVMQFRPPPALDAPRSVERLVEEALPLALHEREDLLEGERLEVLGLAVLLEGVLVAAPLVDHDGARVLGGAVCDPVGLPRLLPPRGREVLDELRGTV